MYLPICFRADGTALETHLNDIRCCSRPAETRSVGVTETGIHIYIRIVKNVDVLP